MPSVAGAPDCLKQVLAELAEERAGEPVRPRVRVFREGRAVATVRFDLPSGRDGVDSVAGRVIDVFAADEIVIGVESPVREAVHAGGPSAVIAPPLNALSAFYFGPEHAHVMASRLFSNADGAIQWQSSQPTMSEHLVIDGQAWPEILTSMDNWNVGLLLPPRYLDHFAKLILEQPNTGIQSMTYEVELDHPLDAHELQTSVFGEVEHHMAADVHLLQDFIAASLPQVNTDRPNSFMARFYGSHSMLETDRAETSLYEISKYVRDYASSHMDVTQAVAAEWCFMRYDDTNGFIDALFLTAEIFDRETHASRTWRYVFTRNVWADGTMTEFAQAQPEWLDSVGEGLDASALVVHTEVTEALVIPTDHHESRVSTPAAVPDAVSIMAPMVAGRPDDAFAHIQELVDAGKAEPALRAMSMLFCSTIYKVAEMQGVDTSQYLQNGALFWAAYMEDHRSDATVSLAKFQELASETCTCGHRATNHESDFLIWESGRQTRRHCSLDGCACRTFTVSQ